jgi:hypothetical protein
MPWPPLEHIVTQSLQGLDVLAAKQTNPAGFIATVGDIEDLHLSGILSFGSTLSSGNRIGSHSCRAAASPNVQAAHMSVSMIWTGYERQE